MVWSRPKPWRLIRRLKAGRLSGPGTAAAAAAGAWRGHTGSRDKPNSSADWEPVDCNFYRITIDRVLGGVVGGLHHNLVLIRNNIWLVADKMIFACSGNEVIGNADRHKPQYGQHFALIFGTIKYMEADKSCQDVFMFNLSTVKYLPVTRSLTQGHSQAHNINKQNKS